MKGWETLLRLVRGRRGPERAVDDEIGFHLEMVEEKLRSRGMDAEEARAEALRRFGDRDVIRRRLLAQARRREERMRWTERWDSWRTDLVFAGRQLTRSPGTSALAVAVLALAIGAGTAVFSIVDSVLLAPLPFPEPDELVVVHEVDPDRGFRTDVSAPTYLDWRDATTVDGLTVLLSGDADLTEPGRPARVGFASVSRGFFGVLGVPPARGRGFTDAEDRSGAAPVAVISHRLARQRFGEDLDPLGRTVTLRGRTLTVVGVTPPGFDFPEGTDVWAPLFALPGFDATIRGARILQGVARLDEGTTLATAEEELATLNRRAEGGYGAALTPLKEHLVGELDRPLLLLLGAVGLVLLVACANVGNVLLTRALGRRRELAVRAALGAGRSRVTATLLTESLLVAALAGIAGILAAWLGTDLLLGLAPTDLPRTAAVGLDLRVLGVALGVTLFTGFAVGIFPALQASEADIAARLRAGDTRQSGDRASGRMRSVLVVGQVTVTLVLLAGAGLLGRSFVTLLGEDPGFDPSGLATVAFDLPRHRYDDPDRLKAFYDEVLSGVQALPQVTGAALTRNLPLSGTRMTSPALVDGGPHDPDLPQTHISWVTSGYFEVMGIAVRDGRSFEAADADAERTPVVVNETFARTFFPDGSAVGREAHTYFPPQYPHRVAGVVEDVRHGSLSGEIRPLIYHLLPETPSAGFHMVIRTAPGQSAASAFPGLRTVLAGVDPELPPPEVATMGELISRDVAEPRFYAVLLGAFAVLTLTLAALGLYGLMTTTVLQQRREIGIRLALGAGADRVTKLFVRKALLLAGAGVAVGLPAAFLAARSLEGLLYGIEPADPVTLAGVSLLLLATCLLAVVVPVRRAARVDPTETLREE